MSGQWQRVAAAADVPDGGSLQVRVGTELIGLFNLGGTFHATSDICTHAYACLTDGFIDGENVECPLHQALFHIPTGRAVGAPAVDDLKVYAVRVEGGDVYVEA